MSDQAAAGARDPPLASGTSPFQGHPDPPPSSTKRKDADIMPEKKTVEDGRDLYRRYAEGPATTLAPERDPKILAGHVLFDQYDEKTAYASRTITKEND